MADVATWTNEFTDTNGLLVRWTWTRGATPKQFKITAQAYEVVEGQVRVHAQCYTTWPSRSCHSVEALMLYLVAELDKTLAQPMIEASAAA